MEITVSMIKELRDRTGAGILDCRQALEAAGGDLEKAARALKEKGLDTVAKTAGREAREGLVHAYIHAGDRVGALVELNCETDFVARTKEFRQLAHDIAMQVVGAKARYVDVADVPPGVVEAQKEAIRLEMEGQKKPPQVMDRIIEGRLAKFFDQACLLRQPFIRDEERAVRDIVAEAIAMLGENIVVRRFARFELGGE